MQTSLAEQRRPAPLAVATLQPQPDGALTTELHALNHELRELKSTDHALRAYVEGWLALVSLSVTGKLVFDWFRTDGKAPWLAIPIAILGVGFLVDAIRQKFAQRKLGAAEQLKLDRQRELRRLLGIDDAPVPPLS